MRISEEQVEFIQKEIASSSIKMKELKDDLLDHFCCFIEFEMKKGMSFEDAYKKAYQNISPSGFNEIEKETIFLLNFKKIVMMKKFMYFIGLASSISISIGWLFNLMHWPGGGELFTYGFLCFVMVFLPLVAIEWFKVNINKALSDKLRIAFGLLSALIVGLAVFFKMMHWPGAGAMLVVGTFLFTFGFLPFLFFNMYKKSVN